MKFLYLLLPLFVITACNRMNDDIIPQDEGINNNLYFPPVGSHDWDTIDPDSIGWNVDKLDELYTLLEDNGTRGFILLKDGKIVIEQYFGKDILGITNFTKDRVWYWASAGKTLTSFTVGKAQEEGYLSIDAPTSTYLGTNWTSLQPDDEEKITVRNQLTMTTGLDDGIANSDETKSDKLLYKAPAGERWAYHNAPYTLLDQVVENAVGEDFDTYFETVLQNKIGMSGYWSWLGNNHVYFSTPRDMARFGLLMLNKGQWIDTPIIQDTAYYNAMITPSQSINKSYGYLFWLNGGPTYMLPETQFIFQGNITPSAPSDMYSGLGKNGQYVSVIPSQNLVMIRMGENPDQVAVPLLFLTDIWDSLNQIIQ